MGNCCAHNPEDDLSHSELQPGPGNAPQNPNVAKQKQANVRSSAVKMSDETIEQDEAREAAQAAAQAEAPEGDGEQLAKRQDMKFVTKSTDELEKIAKARGRGHRDGVSAEQIDQDTIANFVKPVHPKGEDEKAKLAEIIQKNEKMEVMCGALSGDALIDVVNAFFTKEVKQGSDVIRQGDAGDFLYICQEGTLDIFVSRADPDTGKIPEGKGDKVVSVGAGALFGELALMYSAPRAATVTVASESAKLWALERDAFKMLLVSKGQKQFQLYQGYLKEVELLKPFNDHELSQIADMMESTLFDENEVIIQQGDPGESFFIVEDGTAEVIISGAGGDQVVKSYKAGEYFGEIALLTDEPRRATVKASGEGATVLAISKEDFANVLGPITDKLRQDIEKYPKYADFLK